MQQKEEGKVQRHFGAAAKAIEAERALKQEAEAAAAGATAFRITCSEPEREADKVDQLYKAFLAASKKPGNKPAS